jgi:hypothetical protein
VDCQPARDGQAMTDRHLSDDQRYLIDAVVAEHQAMRATEEARRDAGERRRTAIAAAKAAQVPLTAIAEVLGVSLERVRQMERA